VPPGDTNNEMTALAAAPALESLEAWHLDLSSRGARGDAAAARLHMLLLRAARFEVFRRRSAVPGLSSSQLDELAVDAAGDAAVSILRRLDDFRGESRFETWAYKFALLEAAVKVRRRAWRDREVMLDPEGWERFAALTAEPDADAEQADLLACVREGIQTALTPHQREVLVAVVLDGVPIDVLAERLDSNRNALYKTIHDARSRLRSHVAAAGHLEVT
jgi:RNA polymerase sigma-70 factor, ECF subfamily